MGSFLVDFALVFGGFIVGSWLARRGHGGDKHGPCVPLHEVETRIKEIRVCVELERNKRIADLEANIAERKAHRIRMVEALEQERADHLEEIEAKDARIAELEAVNMKEGLVTVAL